MIQGTRAALHEGTVVYVSELAPVPIRAVVLARNATNGKWRVQLQGGKWQGRELFVPEDALRLSFCLLPSSPSKFRRFVRMEDESAQGTCGRGLVVQEPVPAGAPIFAEEPLLVIGGLVLSHRSHHSERWLAYAALQKRAQLELQQAATGVPSGFENAGALAAFNELGIASHVPTHVREGAENIAMKLFEDASRVDEVTNVLMRFHSNQFRFDNGAAPTDTAFASSAVYSSISRVNHSCAPAMTIEPARLYAQRHALDGIGESVEESGGMLIAVAARELQAGERLTFCYGPAELAQSWDLHKRRDFLLNELGFTCGCERCVVEEEAERACTACTATEGGLEDVPELPDEIDEAEPAALPAAESDVQAPRQPTDEVTAERASVTAAVPPTTATATIGECTSSEASDGGWKPVRFAKAAVVVAVAAGIVGLVAAALGRKGRAL